MKTAIIGFPRIGKDRELKFFTEEYFKGKLSEELLVKNAAVLKNQDLKIVANSGVDFIPSNDFSFYDNALDAAALLNIIPKRYSELGLSTLGTYFAMARGYQGEKGDVKALPMKKWFNTNYHYIVPEIADDTEIKLAGTKIFDDYNQAKQLGIKSVPTMVGPFTLLSLAIYTGSKKADSFVNSAVNAYKQIFKKLSDIGAEWIQIDEPFLVTDLAVEQIELFKSIYTQLLAEKNGLKIKLQTYFGDIRDVYSDVNSLEFDGVGLDFIEGRKSLELIEKHGFSDEKILFAGVLNGKNIWRNNYKNTLSILEKIKSVIKAEIVISTSCSLLHVPYTVESEGKLGDEYKAQLSFAVEKLGELEQLSKLSEVADYEKEKAFKDNESLIALREKYQNPEVKRRVENIPQSEFTRLPAFEEREKIQKKALCLPLFPTTTIGSFPQTAEVKSNRARFKKGEIPAEEYKDNVKKMIKRIIEKQEELGFDVLVHGEYERNDMVEHFGENLDGFIFTSKAWVQSYGTRCVKPPIIWSDISRKQPITVEYSAYAQSLTNKPVKGMLTGPVTIFNWSFPREDISARDSVMQIALAIREEVLDLEEAGIKVIQVDEAALKEKLPIRREDWHKLYLDWAIPAFRLVHSGVKAQTQIHTHMCYSEFNDIIKDIDNMDADVISFEASRSNLKIIDALHDANFKTQVGPGVYDIHSPRIPDKDELVSALHRILKGDRVKVQKLWVNPDCGLKTRGESETFESLTNLVNAARQLREEYKGENS
ncbi:MAG: 5-methyltetrahydropteroyltriglutamate--homocysteine S-methyltransferase [Clostridiales bacterium]|nr:5-methyltetrahydropteroyltriglutamate--homocysteine S-methyltransferase [Clostridiales bacterium]